MTTANLIQRILKHRGYDLGNSGPNKDGVDGSLGGLSETAILAELLKAGPVPEAKPPTPREFIAGFIGTHEGGLSVHPKDNGNYQGGKVGDGKLVGSKYGVTAPALARHRGVSPYTITAEQMAALTLDEAIDIGVQLYYEAPRFTLLPWNRVTASVVDKGWGSGPGQAIKLVQRMLGVPADGTLGPQTAAQFKGWVDSHGEEAAARTWAGVRLAFDKSLNQPVFLPGWNNRTNSFLPGTKWWADWEAA